MDHNQYFFWTSIGNGGAVVNQNKNYHFTGYKKREYSHKQLGYVLTGSKMCHQTENKER